MTHLAQDHRGYRARLRRAAGALAVAALVMTLPAASAAAAPPEPEEADSAALNAFIDPAVLEATQSSIVGLVIKWEEPEDPWAFWTTEAPTPPPEPAWGICTGWFATPTTIVTAGHCVDPKIGREELDFQQLQIDPNTGMPVPPPAGRPEPKRTVWAFQPRETLGAVLEAPVIVRVDSFRPGEEGDTARLDIHGMPAAKPLPIASAPPRLGETVTSIGFAGLNLMDTDGIDLEELLAGDKPLADQLQDSRLRPVNTSGTIMANQFRSGSSVWQVGADFAGGMSGGPTINARGEVYGVNSKMTVWGQNFNVITDPGMLRDFLDHDNPTTPAPPTPQPATADTTPVAQQAPWSPDATPLWITLLAGLAGIGIGALAVTLNRRRTRRPPAECDTPDATSGKDELAESDA